MRCSGRPAEGGSCVAATPRRAVALGLALVLCLVPLAGCGGAGTRQASSDAASEAPSSDESAVVAEAAEAFSARDLSAAYDDRVVEVALSDAGTTADGQGVSVEGSVVSITAGGTYVLSGTLADGQVVVDAPDDASVQIVLDGASVSCSSGAAVLVREAKKCFLTLAEGTDNALASTGGLDQDDSVDGAVFSRADLTVNGTGTLAVSSCAHGVVCKGDLVLASATATVDATGSAVQARDSVAVASGSWTLVAGTDCLHVSGGDGEEDGWAYVAGGTLDLEAGDDGMHADGAVQVDGGDIRVSAADDAVHAERALAVRGGSVDVTACYEGLEGSQVYLADGDVSIVSSDDGVNAVGDPDEDAADEETAGEAAAAAGPADEGATASGDGPAGTGTAPGQGGAPGSDASATSDTALVSISGGRLVIRASGDGIDSNGDLEVCGGEVYVSGPTGDGDGFIDVGDGHEATITGGTVVCVGSLGMAEGFGSSSTQASALVGLSGSAGDEVRVTDASGTLLASMVAGCDYQCVLASAPGMEVGGECRVSNGSGEADVSLDSVSCSDVTTSPAAAMGAPGGPAGEQGAGGGALFPGRAPPDDAR